MKQLIGIKSTIDFKKLRHEFREHKKRVKILQSYKPNEWWISTEFPILNEVMNCKLW